MFQWLIFNQDVKKERLNEVNSKINLSFSLIILDKCPTKELKSREGYWMHELK